MSMHNRHGDPARSEDAQLVRELRAIRPRPREGFRRELDARVAAGFPPRRRDHGGRSAADGPGNPSPAATPSRRRLRLPSRLRLGPALAGAAIACAVAAAIVVSGPDQVRLGGGDSGAVEADVAAPEIAPSNSQTSAQGAAGLNAGSEPEVEAWATDEAPAGAGRQAQQFFERNSAADRDLEAQRAGALRGDAIAADRTRRAVERDASITLASEPTLVDEVAAGVLRIVGTYGGIVMSSTTRGGAEGVAGAEFALKIPAARLGQALTELSELAPLRDRRESTLDITAPTVSTADRLREARAEVRGLLKQLAEATSDSERETIQIDLRPAQRRVARLRSRLDRLERRANFADVRVSIVTGDAGSLPEEDGWTISRAADDALAILTWIAGILIVAAAILAPFALIVLTAWLLRRAWLRRSRERALHGDRPPVRPGGKDRAESQPS